MNVLIPLDQSVESQAALTLAERLPRQARLHLCMALDPPVAEGAPEMLFHEVEDEAMRYLRLLAEDWEERVVETHVVADDTVPGILGLAEKLRAECIVMASHGRTGWRRMMLGSVTEAVLHAAKFNVLVAHAEKKPVRFKPGHPARGFERILVPLEFAEEAVPLADRVGRWLRVEGELVLLHVTDAGPGVLSGPERELLAVDLERAFENELERVVEAGWNARLVLQPGQPHAVIGGVCQKEGCDLIAMHVHGRTGIGRVLLGSVTDAVVRSGPAPVLVLCRL